MSLSDNQIAVARLAQNHALVVQRQHLLVEQVLRIAPHRLCDRYRRLENSTVAHGFGEEARIHQVHSRMFNPARILIDGQPIRALFRIERATIKMGTQVAIGIPRRTHEGIHRIRFALSRAAAVRASGI
jgi:hypothetical protein